VEDDDDAAQEEIWRADEKMNGEIAVDAVGENLAQKGKDSMTAATEV
jgi:hypothetical protein